MKPCSQAIPMAICGKAGKLVRRPRPRYGVAQKGFFCLVALEAIPDWDQGLTSEDRSREMEVV